MQRFVFFTENNFVLAILQEASQENMPSRIGHVLKVIDDKFRGQFGIEDNYVILNRADLNESTSAGKNGVQILPKSLE